MSWNGPIGGDWNAEPKPDYTKAPWAAGCMTLSHDEVLFVIDALPPIEEEFLPDTNMVISKYNNLTGYEKAINGDTYAEIKKYDPTVNTQGIDSNGIIPEPVIEQPTEQPTEEV
jgi:hypothetical protein